MENFVWFVRKMLISSIRDVKQLILYFCLPLIGVLLSMLIYSSSGEVVINVGIVNEDGNELVTQNAIQFVAGLDHVQAEQMEEAKARELVVEGKLDAAIIFSNGFTESINNGQSKDIEVISINGSTISAYLSLYLNQYVNNLIAISNVAQGDMVRFNELYADVHNAPFKMTTESVKDVSAERNMSKQSVGYLAVLILFSAFTLSGMMIKEKENRTYYRLIASPISARSYIGSNIAVSLIMLAAQIAVMLVVMTKVFHIQSGVPLYQMFMLLLLFALVAISVANAVVAFSSSSMTVGGIQNLVIFPTCLLAGCFFPLNMMPDALQRIASFLPQHWLLDTFSKLQLGESLQSLYLNMVILAAFALTFALIAMYRFTRNDDTRSYI